MNMEESSHKEKSYHDILSELSILLKDVNDLLAEPLIDNNPEMEEYISAAHEYIQHVYSKIHHITYNNSNSIRHEHKRL